MSKQNAKRAKIRSAHDEYELPDELDFSKLKFVGFGLEALEQYSAKKRTVELDPDVARVFNTSESVNTILRAIIQGLTTKKRKKSA